MYHKTLEHDLKKIFGMKKVVFSSVDYGEEQDVLYCEISSQRNRPHRGGYYFHITGTIGFNSQYKNTAKGFFHYKWLESNHAEKFRLGLGGYENNVFFAVMDKYFCKSRIDFVYTIIIPFNPAQKTQGFLAKFYKLFNRGK